MSPIIAWIVGRLILYSVAMVLRRYTGAWIVYIVRIGAVLAILYGLLQSLVFPLSMLGVIIDIFGIIILSKYNSYLNEKKNQKNLEDLAVPTFEVKARPGDN